MKIRVLFATSALLGLTLPTGLSAQTSIGVGIARAHGEYSDRVGAGYTVRGQTGRSLLQIAETHLQGGWTHFAEPGGEADGGSGDIYHIGVGARAGSGMIWVGLNGAWFFGDGEDGIGYVPEIGVGLGPLEAVLDVRVDGDARWWALRGALRF